MTICISGFQCPADETTIKYDFNNPNGFDTTLDGSPVTEVLRGSGGDLPVSPDDEVVIVTDTFPGDDYRVMEFEFDVNPDDDGDDEPTIVTVTFRLTNGTDVLVIREVSRHGRIRI